MRFHRGFPAAWAALLALLLALPAPAAERLHTSISGEALRGIMLAEGYNAQALTLDKDGDVVWKLDGYRTNLIIDDDGDSIEFSSAFTDPSTLEKVNAWNRSKRYSRSYLDADGDPVLELDLDLSGGVTQERILDFLRTCELSFEAWRKEVL